MQQPSVYLISSWVTTEGKICLLASLFLFRLVNVQSNTGQLSCVAASTEFGLPNSLVRGAPLIPHRFHNIFYTLHVQF